MTSRRLTIVFRAVGTAQDAIEQNRTIETAIAADGTFLVQGEIDVAKPDGTYEVTVTSTGQRLPMGSVTDEPLERGMLVWVSRVGGAKDFNSSNWIVHGSIK